MCFFSGEKRLKPQPSILPPTPTCQAECGEREKWYGTRYSTQPLPQDWLQVRWSGCRLSGGQPLANAARSLAAAAASTAFGKGPAAFCRVSCAMLSLLRSVLASCSLICPRQCVQEWVEGAALPELHLPHTNPFIPQQFGLLEVGGCLLCGIYRWLFACPLAQCSGASACAFIHCFK